MRGIVVAFGLIAASGIAAACATTEDDLGTALDSGLGGSGGFGGYGTGGTPLTGGTGGTTGGTGGTSGSGGVLSDASTGGSSSDASSDGPVDAGNPSGFGPCVTHAEIANQSGPFMIGFCGNPFACLLCTDDAVKPGDIVCSPKCLCVPLPPLCIDDAGADSGDAASDASSDAPLDAPLDAPKDAPPG
ncbi:MAG TPA: hypothetical protein PKA88_00360 [Polyangiaceae bacterium]|nr:hypothetical protein [Polyangiaceae bacterium]HMR76888.1 hypothetical protein [Polyangiaceae bacterium]